MAKYSKKVLAELLLNSKTNRQEAIQAVAGYLVSNGRSKELPALVREIELQAEVSHGHTTAYIHSARQLDDHMVKDLESVVKKISKNESVEIVERVDPSLLGGVRINTPEREADFTLKGKLSRLKVV